jgi:hypothetical protein
VVVLVMSDTVNLTAAFNAQIRKIPGGERFLADPLEVDIGAVAVAVAEAWAADMRENLQAGRRPDGKGAMPKRESGGRRGEGTATVASISARWSKTLNRLVVAADEPNAGALARILRGIPFRPPANSARVAAVQGDAVLIATMHGTAATKRGRTWSPQRLASWRKWRASKK